MIQLTCANCQATLEVDDAFAGGVCRCQHCGTIQTVPRPGGRPQSPGGPNEAPRALYQVVSRTGTSSAPSGLEELAEVIHSSGLSGSGLRHQQAGPVVARAPRERPAKSRMPLIAAIIGAAVVLLIATLVAMLLKKPAGDAGANPADPQSTVTPPPTLAEATASPNFAGVPLTGDKVIFVIDRGDATADYFPSLKTLTNRAVLSLGSDRKFQVVLWENGSVDSYPASGPGDCSQDEAAKLSSWLDDVSTGRPSDAKPAIKAAMTQSPDTIVLITAKSVQISDSDPQFAADVLGLRGAAKTVFDGITLGDSIPADPLKKIALETGGTYRILSRADIDRLGG